MKTVHTHFRKTTLVLGVVLVAMTLATQAFAGCGDTPTLHKQAWGLSGQQQSWDEMSNSGMLVRTAAGNDVIVGMWKVVFSVDDNAIDTAYVQWHSDGTEIMNSSKPPATSNFCLGVWRKLAPGHYKLNHFAISSDINGNLIGPTNIKEDILLDKGGVSYTGSFVITNYDTNGNVLGSISGTIAATRLTVESTPHGVL